MMRSTQGLEYGKEGDPDCECVHMFLYNFPTDCVADAVEFLLTMESVVYLNRDVIHNLKECDQYSDYETIGMIIRNSGVGLIFFTNRTDALLFQLKTGAKAVTNAEVYVRKSS